MATVEFPKNGSLWTISRLYLLRPAPRISQSSNVRHQVTAQKGIIRSASARNSECTALGQRATALRWYAHRYLIVIVTDFIQLILYYVDRSTSLDQALQEIDELTIERLRGSIC